MDIAPDARAVVLSSVGRTFQGSELLTAGRAVRVVGVGRQAGEGRTSDVVPVFTEDRSGTSRSLGNKVGNYAHVAVDVERDRVGRPAESAAPAGEVIAGGSRGREGHRRPTGIRAAHRIAAHCA